MLKMYNLLINKNILYLSTKKWHGNDKYAHQMDGNDKYDLHKYILIYIMHMRVCT